MSERSSTVLRTHPKAEVWRQDRLDPSGNPVVIFSGATFMDVKGERRLTPDRPTFGTQAEAEAWFARKIAEPD